MTQVKAEHQTVESKRRIAGILITVIGACFWGFSGASSELLMKVYHMEALQITSIRMLSAGLVLLLALWPRKGKQVFALWQNKQDIIELILFSVFGLAANTVTYLYAIRYSNAGTATAIQYTSPLFVLLWICLKSKRLPSLREFLGILMTGTGIFLISTHGQIGNLAISKEGLAWSIAAAITLALYNLIPIRIIAKYGALTICCFGMLSGGVIHSLIFQTWKYPLSLDLSGIGALLVVIFIGTVIPYSLYLQGVSMIGAVKASMIATIEPLSATLFSAILVGTTFHSFDYMGFVLIILTILIISAKSEK